MSISLKSHVKSFWESQACGNVYAQGKDLQEYFRTHSTTRYALEPYILDFARFSDGHDKDVLEIGVGMGADHEQWAMSEPRSLTGIDLTRRAIDLTCARFEANQLNSKLTVADAEHLPFGDNSFDIIYSWGVLHHSPDTAKAFKEVYRVLKPGGIARIMIYHRHSIVAYLLWLRFGLFRGSMLPLTDIFAQYVESPGTKAYTLKEARELCADFNQVDARSLIGFGDLLQGAVGQRYPSRGLDLVKKVWPRWLIRRVLKNHGTALLIEASK
jgi:ubiquinone/menaquinone biosynthesis C-methylase UbiE